MADAARIALFFAFAVSVPLAMHNIHDAGFCWSTVSWTVESLFTSTMIAGMGDAFVFVPVPLVAVLEPPESTHLHDNKLARICGDWGPP